MSKSNRTVQMESKNISKAQNSSQIFKKTAINILNTISTSIKEYYKACKENLKNKKDLIKNIEDNIEIFILCDYDKKDISELNDVIFNIKEISDQLKLYIESDENNILDFYDDAKILFQSLKVSINEDRNNLDKICKKRKPAFKQSLNIIATNTPNKRYCRPIINNNFTFDISALEKNNSVLSISPNRKSITKVNRQKSLSLQDNYNTLGNDLKFNYIKNTDELNKYKNLSEEYYITIQKLMQENKLYREQLSKFKICSSLPEESKNKNFIIGSLKNTLSSNTASYSILNIFNKNYDFFGPNQDPKLNPISLSPNSYNTRTNNYLNLQNLLSKTRKEYKEEIGNKNTKILELTKLLNNKNWEVLELQKENIEKNRLIENLQNNNIQKEEKEKESNNIEFNKINEYEEMLEKKQNQIEGLIQVIYKINSDCENQEMKIEKLKIENEKLKNMDKNNLTFIQNCQMNNLNKKLEESEKEILSLKQKNDSLIKQLEKIGINNNQYFDYLSEDLNLSNCEEEFDLKKVIRDAKDKERSQDVNIDYPGIEKIKKKYKELEYDYNFLIALVKKLLLNIKCNSSNKIYITELGKIVGFSDDIVKKIIANKSR